MQKRKSKKKKIIIIIAIILIVVLWIGSCTSKMKKAMEELSANNIKIDEVTKRDLINSVGATGSIASINSRNITIDIANAEIKKINVKVGDVVKKGTVLANVDVSNTSKDLSAARNTLNNTKEVNSITLEDAKRNLDNLIKKKDSTLKDIKNQRDAAKKDYNNAKKDNSIDEDTLDKLYDKYTNLIDSYYDTKEEYEEKIIDAENEIKKLELTQDTSDQESRIRTYSTEVKNGTIKAPIDGTITNVYYEVGDTYTAGSVFMTIQDCSAYEIEAEIGEYDVADIKVGQKVVIKTDATGEEEIDGTVKEVSPVATKSEKSTNKTYTVKISVNNMNDRIKLDMTANISIVVEEHKNILAVPYNAVYTDQNGKYYVIKADNDKKENVYVDVIMESSYYTEISGKDIYEGMKVYLENKDDENPLLTIMQNGGF